MHNNLISIIIPAYNSQGAITEAVQSCLNQTWQHVEVIVVNDGSTDNTLKVLEEIRDNRINIINQENRGACAARNLGLLHAKGSYIQFLDADDIISPDKIKNQLLLLKENNSMDNVASCAWGRFYNSLDTFVVEDSPLNKSYICPMQWLLDSWNGKGMGQTAIWLTPTSLIKKAGPWNENLKINQDGEFFARVLLQAKKIVYCPKSQVYYRSSNASSISKAPFSEAKVQSLLLSFQLYVQHVPEELKTLAVREALARNFAEIIYRFDNVYPQVVKSAWLELNKLEVKNIAPIGGTINRLLIRKIGFKFTMWLRSLFLFKIKALLKITRSQHA